MSDVSTTDLIYFNNGRRSILATGSIADTKRPDAHTTLYSVQEVLTNMEGQELRNANGMTQRMVTEKNQVEQWSRFCAIYISKSKVSRILFKNIDKEHEMQGIKMNWNLRLDTKQR